MGYHHTNSKCNDRRGNCELSEKAQCPFINAQTAAFPSVRVVKFALFGINFNLVLRHKNTKLWVRRGHFDLFFV
jgi:hypothetical protein